MLQELKNKGSLLLPKQCSRTHPTGKSAQILEVLLWKDYQSSFRFWHV